MRDPDRIPKIIELLERLWEHNPDLRLGQIIANALPSPGVLNDYELYLFMFEDDRMIKCLEKMVEEHGV